MIFKGNNLTVSLLEKGIAELSFASQGSVNIFNRATFSEFSQALASIKANNHIQGLLISSIKPAFMMGADITEFLGVFEQEQAELTKWIKKSTDVFDALEDLPIPTLAAVNGFALGGGCELMLACDYRLAATDARIGLPEVKLGIMPGFGGTVRLPRLIGADNAIEWITTARIYTAEQALAVNTVDAVAELAHLKTAALRMLSQAIDGTLAWQAKRRPKLQPLTLSSTEALMSFSTCKAMVAAKAGKHYPAPMAAVEAIEAAATLDRAGAMQVENKLFAKLAKTDAATALVGLFLAEQVIKTKVKRASQLIGQANEQASEKTDGQSVNRAAVIGAGIMGGGIAYQSAYQGIAVVMKDINQAALDLGLTTASSLLTKQVERGKVTPKQLAKVLTRIKPSLHYQDFTEVECVIEAVVENPKVKGAVLAELEQHLADEAIITTNTSTISIDRLAQSVNRKANFCGMHFFNPVHKMPLVEVIRGRETSEHTVAKVVDFAAKLGKSPIVVNDCPGFYVNRVLFPYLAAFSQLVLEGVDFQQIDQVMEQDFGWPMGPAYLLDVIGLDTAYHCSEVMAQGFPSRMAKIANDPIALLYQANCLGQKSGSGFYQYSQDKKGKVLKAPSEQCAQLLSHVFGQKFSKVVSPESQTAKQLSSVSNAQIIERLMIPMVNEVGRCLEEQIIATPEEADMGLIYGLGFPPFRGGPIRYLDTLGLENFVDQAKAYLHLGQAYQVPKLFTDMLSENRAFYSNNTSKATDH